MLEENHSKQLKGIDKHFTNNLAHTIRDVSGHSFSLFTREGLATCFYYINHGLLIALLLLCIWVSAVLIISISIASGILFAGTLLASAVSGYLIFSTKKDKRDHPFESSKGKYSMILAVLLVILGLISGGVPTVTALALAKIFWYLPFISVLAPILPYILLAAPFVSLIACMLFSRSRILLEDSTNHDIGLSLQSFLFHLGCVCTLAVGSYCLFNLLGTVMFLSLLGVILLAVALVVVVSIDGYKIYRDEMEAKKIDRFGYFPNIIKSFVNWIKENSFVKLIRDSSCFKRISNIFSDRVLFNCVLLVLFSAFLLCHSVPFFYMSFFFILPVFLVPWLLGIKGKVKTTMMKGMMLIMPLYGLSKVASWVLTLALLQNFLILGVVFGLPLLYCYAIVRKVDPRSFDLASVITLVAALVVVLIGGLPLPIFLGMCFSIVVAVLQLGYSYFKSGDEQLTNTTHCPDGRNKFLYAITKMLYFTKNKSAHNASNLCADAVTTVAFTGTNFHSSRKISLNENDSASLHKKQYPIKIH